ncbi:16S rRNA (guanine(527)-N(7))-methyltransferase RsmG [Parasedimentitalea psychrophila]|uniref:Ribosomal RNA small subunit methyltransferase G n=1 Tax=Parasedimentitalea psychrophila TaxID=2997337 RepID=A0A9Y2P2M8_9RHOB|nr:16S rRNA (guanine(527)-N(7))-methyltransferase RsmG [Parasedimentitalea psychrophila]WIY26821.1 16S rRNA (guanine(527)-N(7))-methyltransferase RsmG [Parasedimentitalea psychrophila]
MREQNLLAQLNVSRETMERLEIFEQVLLKWNPKINLVSRASLNNLWTRHIIDSIQVYRSVEAPDHWLDIGSGGGFPGLIVGIMAAEEAPNVVVTLIESDQRKSVFLRTAARECGIKINVLSERIEQVERLAANVLSARALADLNTLLGFADHHLDPDGIALFPKGVTWRKELEEARQNWRFEVDPIKSLTEPDAVILKVRGVARA